MTYTSNFNNLGVSSYELEAWIMRLGSMPIERIAHHDYAGAYEKDEMHVFKLENKKYATVHESGCSCYEARNAEIELFPTKSKALESFEKWKKNHYSHSYRE